MSPESKLQYETPSITVIGTFEEVTQATTSGAFTDVTIPAGTPVTQIPGIISNGVS